MCSPIELQTLDALERADIVSDRRAARVDRHDPALIAMPVADRDLPAMLRLYVAEKEPLWKPSIMTAALASIQRVLSRMVPPTVLTAFHDKIRRFSYTPGTAFWGRTIDVADLLAVGMCVCDTAPARLLELREVEFPYRSVRSLAERYREGLMILMRGYRRSA